MKKILKLILISILIQSAFTTIIQVDHWSMLESTNTEILTSFLNQLKTSVFSDFEGTFNGFIFKNVMKISQLKIIELTPRFNFMKAIFYPNANNTFTISWPLGFHILAEFMWTYNWFILPVSGVGQFDTDIHDFIYNITFTFSNGKMEIDTNFNYSLIKAEEVTTTNLIGADNWIGGSEKLINILDKYYTVLYQNMGTIFVKVMPDIFRAHLPKDFLLTFYFPMFRIVDNETLKLTSLTTRDTLLYIYGNYRDLPDTIAMNSKADRQYCVDSDLISKVVDKVLIVMNATFHNEDLPRKSLYQLTVSGIAQLIPDVIIEYPNNENIALTMTVPKNKSSNIKITRVNDTHGIIEDLPIEMKFTIKNKGILKLSMYFDILVTPTVERRSTGFAFDLEASSAIPDDKSIKVESKYKTYIMSNIKAASSEYLSYLFLPYIGQRVLGDGILIDDGITRRSRFGFTIANSAICLDLIRIR